MFGHRKTLLFVLEWPFTLVCLFTSPNNPHKTKCFFPIRLWLNVGRLGCFLPSHTHFSSWEQWKSRYSLTRAFSLCSSTRTIRATGLKPLSRHLIYRQRHKNDSTKKVLTAVVRLPRLSSKPAPETGGGCMHLWSPILVFSLFSAVLATFPLCPLCAPSYCTQCLHCPPRRGEMTFRKQILNHWAMLLPFGCSSLGNPNCLALCNYLNLMFQLEEAQGFGKNCPMMQKEDSFSMKFHFILLQMFYLFMYF